MLKKTTHLLQPRFHVNATIGLLPWLFCSMSFTSCGQPSGKVKYVPAKDVNFQYVGRSLKMPNGESRFSQPGVSVYGAFEGAYLDVVVQDYGSGDPIHTNYLAVIIDNNSPYVIRLNPRDTIYRVSTSLGVGLHNFKIVKRTESLVGIVAFKGIRIQENSSVTKHTNVPQLKLLCIGNSITCGYGNDTSIATNPNTGFSSRRENNYASYGHRAAIALGVQYMAFAYSGRGLFKNIDGSTSNVIPSIFDRVFPDDPTYTWDHSTYMPNWIVVNLGTNDFSSETNGFGTIDSSTFVSKYLTFVARLKRLYPSSKIILAVGPLMSDDYPANAKQWTRIQSYVNAVISKEREAANNSLGYIKFDPQTPPYGEDWHPSTATHNVMADQLVDYIVRLVTNVEDDLSGKDFLTVFPNPAKDFIILKNATKGVSIDIFNTNGLLLLTKKAASDNEKIDLNSFKKGAYLLEHKQRSVKFIIE